VGDQFGSLLLEAFNGAEDTGSLVTYNYKVTNPTGNDVTITEVFDNLLGDIDDCEVVLAGEASIECSVLAALAPSYEPVTNVVDVTANGGGQTCVAKDEATVTFSGCTLEGKSELKVDDDKIEWEVTNTGTDTVTIGRILLTWPIEHGNLKKIKVGRDTIWEGSLPPPSADITAFINKLDKRQIKAGDKDKLKFEFDAKLQGTTAADYEIIVNMDEFCSVTFTDEPTLGDFACEKPIDSLTMIWDATQDVTVTAWKGDVGSTSLGTKTVASGGEITFDGFAGSPNDVYWEIFDSNGVKIGESTFHLSCSDDYLAGP
jgi:hypothetical protein